MKNKIAKGLVILCTVVLISSVLVIPGNTKGSFKENEDSQGEMFAIKPDNSKELQDKDSRGQKDSDKYSDNEESIPITINNSNAQSSDVDDPIPSNDVEKEKINLPKLSFDYEKIEPIRVDNNTDLNNTAQERGWPGNGSEANPYIISGYEIDAGQFGCGIFMGNVTDHYVIKDSYIHNSSGNGNNFFKNSGIYIYNNTNKNGVLTNLTLSNNTNAGIYLKDVLEFKIQGNNISNNPNYGVYFEDTKRLTITNNTISWNEGNKAFYLEASNGNDIENNTLNYNNQYAIGLTDDSGSNTIVNNNLSGNGFYGIQNKQSNYTVIKRNTFYDNFGGVLVQNSFNVITSHNLVDSIGLSDSRAGSDSNNRAMYFGTTHQCTISYNTISNHSGFAGYGLSLINFNSGTVKNNTLTNNWKGIELYDGSDENLIKNNTLINSWQGFHLFRSVNNTLSNNELVNDQIHIEGNKEKHWTSNSIDESNTVLGEPVKLIKGEENKILSFDNAGEVILANCTNVTIKDQEISGGVYTGFSNNNTIDNISAFGDYSENVGEYGVYLQKSSKNLITDVHIKGMTYGIHLKNSENNIIENSNISSTDEAGLYAGQSTTITHNTFYNISAPDDEDENAISITGANDVLAEHNLIKDSNVGIFIQTSDNKLINNTIKGTRVPLAVYEKVTIYHNNYIDNSYRPLNVISGSSFSNGYPSGGSYYSSHSGNDKYHGPNQNIPGSDGICDSSAGLYIWGSDPYPLMEPAPTPHVRIEHPSDYPGEDNYITTEDLKVNLTGMYRFSDTLTYEIRLNGGNWIDLGTDTTHTFTNIEDGEYTLEARVTDDKGHTGMNSVEFIKDSEEPVLDLTSPESGSLIKADSTTITWYGYDNTSGVDQYKLKLDGDSWTDVGFSNAHTFTGLSDGEHEVKIKAVDTAGLNSTDNITFEVDTKSPMLKITRPTNGLDNLTYDESFTIEGQTDSTAKLTINGEQVELDSNGEFEYETTLVKGLNPFNVVTKDDVGHKTMKTVYVLYMPDIPELDKEIDGLQSDIESINNDITDLNEQLTYLESDLEENVTEFENEIININSDMTELKQELDALRSYLEENVTALENDLDEQGNDIDKIGDNIATLEDQISNIKDEISTLQEEADTLEQGVETEIPETQNELKEGQSDQNSDISLARNIGIVGIILGIIAIIIAVWPKITKED